VWAHPTKTTAATIETSIDFIAREQSPRWAQFARRFNCCPQTTTLRRSGDGISWLV
jgi:hypothetical protein